MRSGSDLQTLLLPASEASLRLLASIPSKFVSESILRVVSTSEGVLHLEGPAPTLVAKDYDLVEPPMGWLKWLDPDATTIVSCVRDGALVGAAMALLGGEAVDALGALGNGAVLVWDLRVQAHARRSGIGRALLQAIEGWARRRGCSSAVVETQDNNLAACRLYEGEGYRLVSARDGAYAQLPGERQLIWDKHLPSISVDKSTPDPAEMWCPCIPRSRPQRTGPRS